VDPSVYFAVAENCWLDPRGTATAAGLTAIDTMAACPTVSEVEAVTEPSVAAIFAAPTPALVAKPLVLKLLLMMATCADDELQVTSVVTSWVLPSV
jgi:hypothetical protein